MKTLALTKSAVAALAAGGLLLGGIAVASAAPGGPLSPLESASSGSADHPTPTSTQRPTTRPSVSHSPDSDDAADDSGDAGAPEGTHTANPASTLKGDNGFIHSEGRNSVGASRRDGLPKPSQTHSDGADADDDTDSDADSESPDEGTDAGDTQAHGSEPAPQGQQSSGRGTGRPTGAGKGSR